MLYELKLGSDDVEAIRRVSGDRCHPHPHNFTDRLGSTGEPGLLRHLHSSSGYRPVYYTGTFNVGPRAPRLNAHAYTDLHGNG